MKNGALVYYYDLDDCEIKNNIVERVEMSYNKELVWVRLNDNMSQGIEETLVGETYEEAKSKYKLYLDTYKNNLLDNDEWIKELFNCWLVDSDGDSQPTAFENIMIEIIKDKTKVDIRK